MGLEEGGAMRALMRRKQVDSDRVRAAEGEGQPQLAKELNIPALVAIGMFIEFLILMFFNERNDLLAFFFLLYDVFFLFFSFFFEILITCVEISLCIYSL